MDLENNRYQNNVRVKTLFEKNITQQPCESSFEFKTPSMWTRLSFLNSTAQTLVYKKPNRCTRLSHLRSDGKDCKQIQMCRENQLVFSNIQFCSFCDKSDTPNVFVVSHP